jgi:hypothetical protein
LFRKSVPFVGGGSGPGQAAEAEKARECSEDAAQPETACRLFLLPGRNADSIERMTHDLDLLDSAVPVLLFLACSSILKLTILPLDWFVKKATRSTGR